MDASPYAPPKSAVLDVEPTAPIQLYSPRQIQAIAFLFGPMAGAWLIFRNFVWLSDVRSSRMSLAAGIAVTFGLLSIAPFLPKSFPRIVVALAYSIPAYYLAKGWFVAQPGGGIGFRKGWRNGLSITGIGLLWLLVTVAIAVGAYMVVDRFVPGVLQK